MPENSVVGIVTCDRDQSLAACFASYRDNCRRYGRTPAFIIADGSRREDGREGARRAVGSAASGRDIAIRYSGLPERRAFAAALARESSVSRDIVDFALFGDPECARTTGANRNCLLLDTLDTLAFSVDDDTVCRVSGTSGERDSTSVAQVYDPTEFWFFPDRQHVLAARPASEIDVLGGLESYLARPLPGTDGALGEGGEVTLVLPGLVGDSGMGSPRYLLTLEEPSRERLLASRASYRSALASREVVRIAPQSTIASTAFCMTPFYGFDGRRLLPPFCRHRPRDGRRGIAIRIGRQQDEVDDVRRRAGRGRQHDAVDHNVGDAGLIQLAPGHGQRIARAGHGGAGGIEMIRERRRGQQQHQAKQHHAQAASLSAHHRHPPHV
jgi:hypothetical protein